MTKSTSGGTLSCAAILLLALACGDVHAAHWEGTITSSNCYEIIAHFGYNAQSLSVTPNIVYDITYPAEYVVFGDADYGHLLTCCVVVCCVSCAAMAVCLTSIHACCLANAVLLPLWFGAMTPL